VLSVAAAALLAGPTVLAFFSGGYFEGPRAWAGIGAWAAVGLAALAGARLPRGRAALLTIGGLSLLAAWVLASTLWAPIAGSAYQAGQIAVLYVGMLVAATMVLSTTAGRIVEPAVAGGALIVVGYGLSERLMPGLLHFAHSVSAQGRLEQPLTYWNAMGELAAVGLVICARLAGDRQRPSWLRDVSAAAVVPLGVGLYISFSRGALFACVAGLLTLVVVARRREQLWAVLRALAAAVLGALAVGFFKGFTSLDGTLSAREREGATALALLAVLTLAAALAQHLLGSRERQGELRLGPRAPLVATGLVVAGLALAIVVGAHESSVTSQQLSDGATRLTTLQSNRYAYWAVAFRAFASEPLHGVGAGGWAVDWLRWRHVSEGAQDAHSLPLQTLAELGVVGIVLLGTFLVGIFMAAREALKRVGALAAGPVAGVVTYLAHAPLDWDWQMPAVTLAVLALIGALLALADPGHPSPAPVTG
jgi:O-antigen ligase